MNQTIAENFWKQADFNKLEDHWKLRQKLSYDIHKIIPHIRRHRKIADVGCGKAIVSKMLDQILCFDSLYLVDINPIETFKAIASAPLHVAGEYCNINESIPQEVKDADCVLWLGGINYSSDEDVVINLANFKNTIIRTHCYDERVEISNYWNEMGMDYTAIYRTVDEVMYMMKHSFKRVKAEYNIYPNSLESKYGGKQHIFVGEK